MKFIKPKVSTTVRAISDQPISSKGWQVRKMPTNEFFEGYKNKLKDRLFGSVLCEREKNGEWEKALDTIIIELMSLKDENDSINYQSLMLKLMSLKFLSFHYFRKTIFECMNLISGLHK